MAFCRWAQFFYVRRAQLYHVMVAVPSEGVFSLSIYEELLASALLLPMGELPIGFVAKDITTKHFVMPRGSSSVVKHFFSKSGKFSKSVFAFLCVILCVILCSF